MKCRNRKIDILGAGGAATYLKKSGRQGAVGFHNSVRVAHKRSLRWVGAILVLALVGCCAPPAPTPQPCVQAPSGLVSWWPGEGDAVDVVGANDGTLEKGATFDAGKVGQAFSFDGINDWVSASGTGIDDLQELTIEAWVKLNSLRSRKAARFVTLTGEKAVLRYDGYSPPHKYLHFYMKIDGQPRHVLVDGVLETGVFHHVAGTYDGSDMRLYLDGVEVGSLAISGALDAGTGIELSALRESLDGLLDEVGIYSRALSPSEIRAIYNGGESGKCSVDADADGIADLDDNCPRVPNGDQSDADSDGVGDACDNCPNVHNPIECKQEINISYDGGKTFYARCIVYWQPDVDGDGEGDACESDIDGDGVDNTTDNCPETANSAQVDSDFDGMGEACDNCPGVPNPDQADGEVVPSAVQGYRRVSPTDGSEHFDECPYGAGQFPYAGLKSYTKNEGQYTEFVTGQLPHTLVPGHVTFLWRCGTGAAQAVGDVDVYVDGEYAITYQTSSSQDQSWTNGEVEFFYDYRDDYCGGYGLCYLTVPMSMVASALDTFQERSVIRIDPVDNTGGDSSWIIVFKDSYTLPNEFSYDREQQRKNLLQDPHIGVRIVGDGIGDACDNCPLSINKDQSNADGDMRGDACDNCPYHSSPNQSDTDDDGRGDVCEINHVVIIDIDGLRADTLASYLASSDSEGGALREITSRKIEMKNTVTVFPSVTFAAQASLFTGVYPSKHGITGNEWFDRTIADKEHRSRSYTATSVNAYNDVLRVYGFRQCGDVPPICVSDRYRNGLANEDLQAKTIYQYASEAGKKSVVSTNMYWKGLTWGTDYLHPTRSDLWDWTEGKSYSYDCSGITKVTDYLNGHEMPDILTLYLPGLDHESHVHGISEQTKYLKKLDHDPLLRLIDRLEEKGVYDNTVFIITSDHGQMDVYNDDGHSIVLETTLDEEIQEVIEREYDDIYDFYDEDDYDSFAGFNSGMLQIYLKNRVTYIYNQERITPGWSWPPDFYYDVLKMVEGINWHREHCDAIFENGDLCETGEDAVEEVLGKGSVIRPTDDYPANQGCEEAINPDTGHSTGFVLCPLSVLEVLHPDYVDPVKRIEGLRHERSGDILLLPAYLNGHHFSGEEDDAGDIKGEHGSLYPGDSYIPFVIAGKPLDRSITITSPKSIVDVTPTVADLLGFYEGIEDQFDGGSVLEPGFIVSLSNQ